MGLLMKILNNRLEKTNDQKYFMLIFWVANLLVFEVTGAVLFIGSIAILTTVEPELIWLPAIPWAIFGGAIYVYITRIQVIFAKAAARSQARLADYPRVDMSGAINAQNVPIADPEPINITAHEIEAHLQDTDLLEIYKELQAWYKQQDRGAERLMHEAHSTNGKNLVIPHRSKDSVPWDTIPIGLAAKGDRYDVFDKWELEIFESYGIKTAGDLLRMVLESPELEHAYNHRGAMENKDWGEIELERYIQSEFIPAVIQSDAMFFMELPNHPLAEMYQDTSLAVNVKTRFVNFQAYRLHLAEPQQMIQEVELADRIERRPVWVESPYCIMPDSYENTFRFRPEKVMWEGRLLTCPEHSTIHTTFLMWHESNVPVLLISFSPWTTENIQNFINTFRSPVFFEKIVGTYIDRLNKLQANYERFQKEIDVYKRSLDVERRSNTLDRHARFAYANQGQLEDMERGVLNTRDVKKSNTVAIVIAIIAVVGVIALLLFLNTGGPL